MYYTYVHTKTDGTVFYVGKGKKRRAWSRHNRNKHWENTVAKNGFEVVILADQMTEQEAIEEEAKIISHFKPFGNLVNLLDRGDINPMSIPEIANKIKGKNHPMYGKHHSEETKERLRKIKTGIYDGDKHPQFKGYILATNVLTGEQKTFAGNVELAKGGFQFQNVSHCLNGKRKTHKGHTFQRINKAQINMQNNTPFNTR